MKPHILIAGAGPVGMVSALVLGHAGVAVTLLEGASALSMDLRASTFHPPTLDMLDRYGLSKTLSAAHSIREVRKQHMIHNSYLPAMEIDPQTYLVRADGQLLTCEPARSLPMAQRYFLF